MADIIIAGGGTGGHVYPALAIAESLVELGIDKDRIVFYGSNHSIEKTVIPANGFKLKTLPGKGLNRRELFKNIGHAFLILFSCYKTIFDFIFSRPSVIVGVGGYASIPALVASSILRIPFLAHEQNSVITRSNKLAKNLDAKMLTTWPQTKGINKNFTRVGLPIRGNFEELSETHKRYIETNTSRPKVLVMGGSMGSVFINDTVIEMVKQFEDEINFDLIHITGARDFERTRLKYGRDFKFLNVFDFCNDVPSLLSLCDLVVSRAGSGSCVEIATIGIQAIFIPLPSAPGDHQFLNARHLADSGMADIILQANLTPERLFETIKANITESIISRTLPEKFHLSAGNRIATMIIEQYLNSGQASK